MAKADEDAPDQAAEDAPAGGRKRSGLLLALGILGGILLGGAVMYLLDGSGPASETAGEPAGEEETKPPEPAVDLLVVEVQRFSVPLITEEKDLLGYVWVDIAIEVDGPENQSYVSARLSELRDAFLRDLYTRQTADPERPGALDFDLLQRRLEAVAKRVMGEERLLAVRIVNARRVPE